MNNYGFQEKPILCFLNKLDLFEVKIKNIDLKVCFDEYNDGKDKDKALKFIEKKYKSANKKTSRQVMFHTTTATDTKVMTTIFNTIQGILLELVLRNTGAL
jgi:hypothetical protein